MDSFPHASRFLLYNTILIEQIKLYELVYNSFDFKLDQNIYNEVQCSRGIKNRLFLTIFRRYSSRLICRLIKTDCIFQINIKNWVDSYSFQSFSDTFIFFRKIHLRFSSGSGLDQQMNFFKMTIWLYKNVKYIIKTVFFNVDFKNTIDFDYTTD